MRVADPVAHAFANRRLWLHAAGPLDVAGLEGPALATALALAGLASGLVRLREAPERLAPPRLALLRRVLPPLAREAFAVDPETLCVPLLGGRLAVLRMNRGDAVRDLGLDLGGLGLRGAHHAFEFFEGRDLGLCARAVAPAPVAPGGCRLLGLTPAADRPQVTGSTLHVGMGTLEVGALRGGGTEGLRLVLRHAGVHRGAVHVAVPGESTPRRVAVSFRDHAEVEVPAPDAGSEAEPDGRGGL
jgi:hypothetical protein